MNSPDRVILRVRDGRQVDLGTPQEFEQGFRGIGDATGGSSGGGQWSFLFDYVPTDEPLERLSRSPWNFAVAIR